MGLSTPPPPDGSTPFVLIDDQRPGGGAILYTVLRRIVETRAIAGVGAALEGLRGERAAGFLSYEAGFALDPALAPLARDAPEDAPPLLWFGLFDEEQPVDAAAWLPDPAGAYAAPAAPRLAAEAYRAAAARIAEHILDGDIYQANLSFEAEVRTAGDPIALYAAIRRRAGAGHGALVFTGAHWLLSFSPELFFDLAGDTLTTRPMKGTALRHSDPAADRAAAAALPADEKQRAENLMIVDLLRNDMARVCRPGSVKVPALFTVETYPTVHQMTSTITGTLAEGRDAVDVIAALFPCGSITGAPKLRAMEIIAGIERRWRGVYTGAIGRLAPDGEARFNVAIRTLALRHGDAVGRLGLGSGLVADSEAGAEWRECLAKGAFVNDPARRFDLIETMRFDPHDGLALLDAHLSRMKASADALGFAFDRHEARNELQAATFRLRGPAKVRLLLARSGALAIEVRPMPPVPDGPVAVTLAPLAVDARDFRLRHKCTDRGFYEAARVAGGGFETVFVDPDGWLTEGSFTNIFVARDGRLLTPKAARGLLPGILRASLIASGEAEEADLTPADLAGGFLIGNAVRGLLPARLSAT